MIQPNEKIEKLYLEMYDFLLNYAEAALGNHEQAEETVQETFLIACEKWEALLKSPNPEGWLVRTMKNLISNNRKNQENTKKFLLAYIALYGAYLTAAEDSHHIDLLYEDLMDTEEMKILREYALDGCTYQEMARRRGISVATCRKRIQRAREILQKKLSE